MAGVTSHAVRNFRVNCAMCHNVAAAGGALTEGDAPGLGETSALHMYAAMVDRAAEHAGFNDLTLTPEEQARHHLVAALPPGERVAGRLLLGSLGLVSEGLFMWIFGVGGLIALTVSITAKFN